MDSTSLESPEFFNIHDSGFEKGEKYIIFATKNSIQHLADGVKNICPASCYLSSPLGNSVISWVYCSMSRKSQEMYENLLTTIVQKAQEWGLDMNPLVTRTDYEQALINALTNVFGMKTKIKTCFYHLSQST